MAVELSYDGKVLLSMLWNQGGLIACGNNETIQYNEYAPLDPLNGELSYTGCGNTAYGQGDFLL